MLAKLGCSYVIVGHSERREYHHEDDALVNAKLLAALRNGITPILCVGETLEVRQAGGHLEHCHTQLDEALAGVSAEQAERLVVAYEPVWAIGTGEVATPEDAQEVCAALRSRLARAVLDRARRRRADPLRRVGQGEATPREILAQPDIDGALVGGASLDPVEFAAICVAAGEPVPAEPVHGTPASGR